MSDLVIATDLGEGARSVVAAGLWLAQRLGARPVLLHADAYDDLVREHGGLVGEAEVKRMAAGYADRAGSALRELARDLGARSEEIQIAVRSGRPHAVVIAEAEERGAQAIVVGSHTKGALETLLLGRTAVRVLREASSSVFTVSATRPWKGISRILCATSLEAGDAPAERWAAELAGRFAAKLTLLSVLQVGSDLRAPYFLPSPVREEIFGVRRARLETLRGQIAGAATAFSSGPVEVVTRVAAGMDPAAVILEEAQKLEADLIVTGTHGRRGVRRALLGSVAEGVVRGAKSCVLTVRAPADPAS